MLDKCLFFMGKIFIQLIQGQYICYTPSARSSNQLAVIHRRFILILLNIVRLQFVFMGFTYLFNVLVKPCFDNSQVNPNSWARKLTRGIFPLSLVFYIFMFFYHKFWFNRIITLLCLVYIILIFRTNDYVPEGLFDTDKLNINSVTNKLEYGGEIPKKYEHQIRMFEDVTYHVKKILPKFKYSQNPLTTNCQFMRISYCPFSGIKVVTTF